MTRRLAAALLPLTAAAVCGAFTLDNPGFENGLQGWEIQGSPEAFAVLPEAASMGKLGLRVSSAGAQPKTSIALPRLAVKPGGIYRVTFWGRANAGQVYARLEFYDAGGRALEPALTKGYWPTGAIDIPGQFHQLTLQAAAPEQAATMTARLNADPRQQAVCDADDFTATELTPEQAERKPLPDRLPPEQIEALLAEIKSDPTRGQPPPKIVLKLDDFPNNWAKGPAAAVHHNWDRMAKVAREKNIKINVGVIAKALEISAPPVTEWMKKLRADTGSGFWLHGYDHAGWKAADGTEFPEGRGRTMEQQLEFIKKSQAIMREKMGEPFRVYGPTGSGRPPSHDEALLDALNADGDIVGILYPQPLDALGRKLEAKGKVRVLDRVWTANLEGFVGRPRFDLLLNGYAHNRGRAYFILQGHPASWGWEDDPAKNESYGDFLKIVDFLKSQGAEFVTPEELCR